MAEMLVDEKTKELVLAAIRARSIEAFADSKVYLPGLDHVNIVYNGTREGSPVRKLFIEFYSDNNLPDLSKRNDVEVRQDFLRDLSTSLIANRPLLRDFNALKNDSARKEKDYKKQITTNDNTIKALQTNKTALQAEKKALQTSNKTLQAEKKALSTECDQLKEQMKAKK